MGMHKGYRIVDCDQEFNVKTIQTNSDVDLKIGSTIGGSNDRIFLGTSEQFVSDYCSGLTENDDVLLTYVYDDADIIQGDPSSKDSEIVVRKARFLEASFFDLETQMKKGHSLREKVIPSVFEPSKPSESTNNDNSKKLYVSVYHPIRSGLLNLMARIAVEDEGDSNRVTMDVLEMAYKATQNFDGSWSMGETLKHNGETIKNEDYNPNVEVMKPLIIQDGREWGHRSSMVGDVFMFRGTFFEVDNVGFKKQERTKENETEFSPG
jgi:hypothetical protein